MTLPTHFLVRFSIALTLLLVGSGFAPRLMAQESVSFKASAPATVGQNQTFRVQFVLSSTSDVSNFQAPDFAGFDVLYGPATSQSHSTQIINGKVSSSSSITYTYTVQAPEKGSFTIAAASVQVGGKTYTSNSLKVEVTEAVAGQSGGQGSSSSSGRSRRNNRNGGGNDIQTAGSAITGRDLYFTATASKRRVYEGEPFVLSYQFFARNGIGLNGYLQQKQQPDMQGFLAEEVSLPSENSVSTKSIGDVLYNTKLVRQYVLFPQQTGTLSVPAVTFSCEVIQQQAVTNMIDLFFNGGGYVSRTIERTTPELSIEVVPLPLPRPASFGGAVGQFSVKGELLDTLARTNDICTYRLTLTGSGNLNLLTAPALTLPKDFDSYTPTTKTNTHLTTKGYEGSVSFDYTFVPRTQGVYTLPSIEFTYFDTQKEEYVTLATDPIRLEVARGERSASDVQTQMQLRESDIRPLRASEGNYVLHGEPYFHWARLPYWLIVAAALLVFALLCFVLYRVEQARADTSSRRERRAAREAVKRMKKAKALLAKGDDRAFHSELSRSLTHYAAQRLHIDQANLSLTRIKELFAERGAGEEEIEAFASVVETCEFAQYAPLTGEENTRERLYARAIEAITALEHTLKTQRPQAG